MTTPALATTEPIEITAGSTVKWKKALSNYKPEDGWSLAYYFRGAGAGLDVEGEDLVVADGGSFLITIPAYADDDAPATSNLSAGSYFWQSWVSNEETGEEYQVGEGRLTVKANLLNSDLSETFDGRTEAEIQLDAVRVALGKAGAKNRSEYSIAGRMKREHSLAELIELEKHLVQRVNAERSQSGGSPFMRNIEVRFVEPK